MAQRIEKELHEQITRLKDDQQVRLLAFARSLADSPGNSEGGKALLRFAGTIEPDDLAIMERVIQNGCETVNLDRGFEKMHFV